MPRNNLSSDAVLNAATELADKEGLRQLSIKKLAENLNVKPPALYNYLDSLDELHVDLAIAGLTELGATMGEAAIGKSGDEALHSVGKAYLSFAKAHPGLYEATQWTNLWNGDPRVIEASEKIITQLRRILEFYELDEIELINTIRAFRSLCHGFASLGLNGGFGNPLVSSDESFEYALKVLLAGIRSLAT